MKILIVDDYAETKCSGIIEECKKRNIQIEIVKAEYQAKIKLGLKQENVNPEDIFNGIILDMGLPKSEKDRRIDIRSGETIIRFLKSYEYKIPVLIFSETEAEVEYTELFGQISEFEKEKDKFLLFLEKMEKEQS